MKKQDVAFEESLSEDWSRDLDVVEIPLDRGPLLYLGIFILAIGLVVGGRTVYLGVFRHGTYEVRAESNLNAVKRISAPRALITDRFNKPIADNEIVFRALLNSKEFLKKKELQEKTLTAISEILGIDPSAVLESLGDKNTRLDDFTLPLILSPNLTQNQLLELKSLGLSTILIENGYVRNYPYGHQFSSVLGYTSLATPDDLKDNPDLTNEDFVGKAGLESYYDKVLQGTPGEIVHTRNSKGEILGNEQRLEPKQPPAFRTTLDSEFQRFFYDRLDSTLKSLGRTTGGGIALNPQTGEILAMISMPSYDPNAFVDADKKAERKDLLTSPLRPLFNRMVSGVYSPGSTIKPLMGLAALAENVISPTRTIYSPGYLDIPNPYNPSKPTRYLDWRAQGYVDLSAALAQSSDVYFYEVGAGWGDIPGLGIKRINEWWKKFGLGNKTGIDFPGEKVGLLPTPEWKEKRTKVPWVLGDTFNVSIGQGDFQITPIQLMNYIDAIANGGKLLVPHLNADLETKVISDMTYLGPEIKEVQKGMRETVTSPLGTANMLNDLPVAVGAKTGSAQVMNNTQENAFVVAYAPFENPTIAVLVMVENAKHGSLNAVPVTKEILKWYYDNRLAKQ